MLVFLSEQAAVAWALSEFCDKDEESQNECAETGGIRLLVYLLAHEMEDFSKTAKSGLATVVKSTMEKPKASKPGTETSFRGSGRVHPVSSTSHSNEAWNGPGENTRTDSFPSSLRTISKNQRDNEDPETKLRLKVQVTRALWKLAQNNIKNSKFITDTRALLCFAKLIETGKEDVQFNSIMAVVAITQSAEKSSEIRKAAFKAKAPAAVAVVEQLIRVIKSGEPELQVSTYSLHQFTYDFICLHTLLVGPSSGQLLHISPKVSIFLLIDNHYCVAFCRSLV